MSGSWKSGGEDPPQGAKGQGGWSDATPAGWDKGGDSGGPGWAGDTKDAAPDPRSAGMEGRFTEVTRTSFGSRLMGALTGVLFGLVLVPGSAYLLFWNEGRAVQTARSLSEGAGAVTQAEAARVDAAMEGRLVHVTGQLIAPGTLRDTDFGVQASGALRLVRDVEMFQWREERRSETRTQLGGAQETVTTYAYTRGWSGAAIDSSRFRQPEGRFNPPMRYQDRNIVAPDARLGARRLTEAQLSGFGTPAPLALAPATLALPPGMRIVDGAVFTGRDPGNPQIGDLRIRFTQVPVGPASIVARQVGDGFAPFQTRAGDTLFMLQAGSVPAAQMFQQAESTNSMITWILRLVGMVLMFAAFSMILRPLSVAGSVVPFIGSIVGVGTGLVAALLTMVLAPLVIALAWIWFRPLVGVIVLVIGLAGSFGISRLIARRRTSAPAPVAAG